MHFSNKGKLCVLGLLVVFVNSFLVSDVELKLSGTGTLVISVPDTILMLCVASG